MRKINLRCLLTVRQTGWQAGVGRQILYALLTGSRKNTRGKCLSLSDDSGRQRPWALGEEDSISNQRPSPQPDAVRSAGTSALQSETFLLVSGLFCSS